MKVGILTFKNAINFGANLQACSTYYYLLNHGYEPIFINYTPNDGLDESQGYPREQVVIQRQFQDSLSTTELCRNSKEVADVLQQNRIHNVIIGSDAVAQHHPLASRVVFPSRRIISIMRPASDKMFPNPYWGEFLDFVKFPINVFLMSVSSQQSSYKYFSKKERSQMMKYLFQMKYISVRDNWTQSMYQYISHGKLRPEITPDPVFAFNYNVSFVPKKDEILNKYGLSEKYILLSLHRSHPVKTSWVTRFEEICNNNGYMCTAFPFPYGISKNNVVKKRIELPLSPIEWYALIKYSSGYVGYNMHTIVSALHNAVPCFSMDQYGIHIFSQFVIKKSSKIYHILNTAGFPNHRSPAMTLIDLTPSPEKVFNMLMEFDKDKCRKFADSYYEKYKKMMQEIESGFINDIA